jgi:hypothetical protein
MVTKRCTAGLALALITVSVLTPRGVANVKSDRAFVRATTLSTRDVPPGFVFADENTYNAGELAKQGTWTLAQLRSWGYLVGHQRQFTRSTVDADPSQLSSSAGAYRTAGGADRSLVANAENCNKLPGWSEQPAPVIGDAAHYCILRGTIQGKSGESHFVVWRQGRFKGSITLSGLEGRVDPDQALALARLQAKRMKTRINN